MIWGRAARAGRRRRRAGCERNRRFLSRSLPFGWWYRFANRRGAPELLSPCRRQIGTHASAEDFGLVMTGGSESRSLASAALRGLRASGDFGLAMTGGAKVRAPASAALRGLRTSLGVVTRSDPLSS